MDQLLKDYSAKLMGALSSGALDSIPPLAHALRQAWQQGNAVYLCGNGGSASNANHLANDLFYGAGFRHGGGLRAEALSANSAILTCLANDIGYNAVYSEQINVKAKRDDILIALSGSGNSENVVRALAAGNARGMRTFAILGYSGGRCKEIAQHSIHFAIDDMQVSEDLQLVVGHICMQWLNANPPLQWSRDAHGGG